MKCPRLDRVLKENERNPEVRAGRRRKERRIRLGLAGRRRAFFAWFVVELQNSLLQDVVDSRSLHGFRNGHFHEENSTKFL